jgi:hypothetical protein
MISPGITLDTLGDNAVETQVCSQILKDSLIQDFKENTFPTLLEWTKSLRGDFHHKKLSRYSQIALGFLKDFEKQKLFFDPWRSPSRKYSF